MIHYLFAFLYFLSINANLLKTTHPYICEILYNTEWWHCTKLKNVQRMIIVFSNCKTVISVIWWNQLINLWVHTDNAVDLNFYHVHCVVVNISSRHAVVHKRWARLHFATCFAQWTHKVDRIDICVNEQIQIMTFAQHGTMTCTVPYIILCFTTWKFPAQFLVGKGQLKQKGLVIEFPSVRWLPW